jgi:hypothetical protein
VLQVVVDCTPIIIILCDHSTKVFEFTDTFDQCRFDSEYRVLGYMSVFTLTLLNLNALCHLLLACIGLLVSWATSFWKTLHFVHCGSMPSLLTIVSRLCMFLKYNLMGCGRFVAYGHPGDLGQGIVCGWSCQH